MSKKYVIDLPDDAQYILINGASENHCYTRVEQVDDIEELNSDYINEHFGELQDEAYQRGLEDAWEAARKIMCDDGIDMNTLCTIFRRGCSDSIIRDYSASEAIAKLKAYEDSKHSDRIEVGDEVIAPYGKAIVTAIKNEFVYYLYPDGDRGVKEPKNLKKTGKHYDIASILEAMRE